MVAEDQEDQIKSQWIWIKLFHFSNKENSLSKTDIL